ncbi:MAG: cation-translocating P-type ATPase [Candidatus Thorarchaeota archaeon]|nr:cation-translocating P-type ATPase [Candidatus Thorarchaeota archaeon]
MSQTETPVCTVCGIDEENENEDFTREYILTSIAVLLFGIALFLDLLLAEHLSAKIIFVAVTGIAGREIIPRGIRGAARIHLDINFLMTFAAISAIIIDAAAEGALVMLLFSIAELLESRANHRVKTEIASLAALQPHNVTLVKNGLEYPVAVESVQVDEIIVIRPGERIGLDGEIVDGTTHIDEATITGESVPVSKGTGDHVFAGTINQAGYIRVRVTKRASDTVLSKIIELVEQAQKNKSRTESMVSRFSHRYTPIVVAASLLLALFSFIAGATPQQALYRGLTLLVTSCPCAFAIAIPVSMVSAITGFAKNGILVKGSRHIETLSKVTTVAFDKTGTLTEGRLQVQNVCLHSEFDGDEILRVAASLEQRSEHPIAMAILAEAQVRGLELSDVDEFRVMPGMGVAGNISGTTHRAGNLKLLSTEKVRVAIKEGHHCGNGSLVYVFRGDRHLGTISLGDTTRRDSAATIKRLKDMGLRSIMVTGDNQQTAEEVASQLGIDEVRANLMPADKVRIVEELSKSGTVMMLGDGINDAPALARADVSVAMGAASSDAAIEAADVALMKDDISRVPQLVKKARRTMRIIRTNVAFSLGAKGIVAILAVLGLAPLWLAIAAGDMGVTFIVVANALRLAGRD